jgi:hypothetical protein
MFVWLFVRGVVRFVVLPCRFVWRASVGSSADRLSRATGFPARRAFPRDGLSHATGYRARRAFPRDGLSRATGFRARRAFACDGLSRATGFPGLQLTDVGASGPSADNSSKVVVPPSHPAETAPTGFTLSPLRLARHPPGTHRAFPPVSTGDFPGFPTSAAGRADRFSCCCR